jgi:uncharacterized protein (DUF1015 family)
MRIRSFTGLRPAPADVEKIVSLPYDVVSTNEARTLAAGNPLSMLHVVRAEIDFPEGTDPYSDEVYAKAVSNFEALQAGGHLIRDEGPALYLYRQKMGEHAQTGIVALSHIDDYEADLIKKHEKTRVAKENDRTRLTSDLSANPGPVFLTYEASAAIDARVEAITSGEPLYDLTSDDGIEHTVWRVPGGEDLIEAFAPVACTYVADGHHRAASAARVGRERREANPDHTGEEDYNWFLTVLFPGNQLKILPYNRLVHDLNGHSKEEILAAINAIAPVQPTDQTEPDRKGRICFFLDGQWYALELSPPEGADPVSSLDVSLLQDTLLAPLLGIDDPRTSDRIDFVGGIRGTGYLEDQVRSGAGAIAFSLYPVTVEELMAIADAGQIMAPKSTWFEPKLRSGFLIHTFK